MSGKVLAAAMAASVFAGCAAGDDGNPAGGGGAPGDLALDYCNPLAALICERADACGCGFVVPGGELDGELDGDACLEAWAQKCLAAYAPVADAVEQGAASVDAAAARACVARIAAGTASCERPGGVIPQALCDPWFTASARAGEACSLPWCADGAGICEEGACAARAGAGEACAGATCEAGLVCTTGGTCEEPFAAGHACAAAFECAPPLRCTDGTCAAAGVAGAPCADDLACAQGLACADGACTAVPEGACTPGSCGALAICAGQRGCVARGGAGAPCADDEACAAGLACEAGSCAALPGDGEACVRGTYCAPGLGCDGDGGTCRPLPGDGAACAFGPDGPFACAAGLGCVDGTCGELPGDGAPCTGDSRCGPGLGCAFRASGSTCVPLADEGEACEEGRTCEAGLSCDGGTCHPLPQACPGGCGEASYCGFTATACVPDLCQEVG